MKERTLAPLGVLKLRAAVWRSKPHPIAVFGDSSSFAIEDEGTELAADVGDAIRAFLALDVKARRAMSERIVAHRARVAPDAEGDVWEGIEAPEEVLVRRRHRLDRDVYLLCACSSDWDREHGLQLVFRAGRALTRASAFDDHLTEADAYGWPSDAGPGALPVGAAVKRKPAGAVKRKPRG